MKVKKRRVVSALHVVLEYRALWTLDILTRWSTLETYHGTNTIANLYNLAYNKHMCGIFGSTEFKTYERLYTENKKRGKFAYGSL